jgi:hypothetical protein
MIVRAIVGGSVVWIHSVESLKYMRITPITPEPSGYQKFFHGIRMQLEVGARLLYYQRRINSRKLPNHPIILSLYAPYMPPRCIVAL